MPKLIWDEVGKRFYETGVSQGVLYVRDAVGAYPLGVPWNGLTAVTEAPSGAEPTKKYADNINYLTFISPEDFAGTIEAFYYPDEFGVCNGEVEIADGVVAGQQSRKVFGLCYKTGLGNDVADLEHGYKLHLVYGAQVSPSEKAYETINETPDAITLSWDFTTTPVVITGHKPAACLVIDSTKADPTKLAALEDALFGAAAGTAHLPLPAEVMTMMAAG